MAKTGNRLLIAGVAIVILSAVLTVTLPTVGYAVFATDQADGAGAQPLLLTVELVARVVEAIASPLGAALVAAGVVVRAMRGADEPAA